MSKIRVTQFNFNQGQIDTTMNFRLDTEIYNAAASEMNNVIVFPEGGWKKRHGTSIIDDDSNLEDTASPITFDFNSEQQYLLLLNGDHVWIYKDDVFITDISANIPWVPGDEPFIRYAQTGDFMYLTHFTKGMVVITRGATDMDWNSVPFTFEANQTEVTYPFFRYPDTFNYRLRVLTGPARVDVETSVSGNKVDAWVSADIGRVFRTQVGVSAKYFQIDSLASAVPAFRANVTWVHDTSPNNNTIVFNWAEQAFDSPDLKEKRYYPRTLTFHENRMYLGGGIFCPSTIFASKVGDITNFRSDSSDDDFGFSYTLATDQVHTIRDLKSHQRLVIFTSDGDFSVYQPNGGAITPSQVTIKQHTNYGIGVVESQIIDTQIVFVPKNGTELRTFGYNVEQDDYVSQSLTTINGDIIRSPISMKVIKNMWDIQSNIILITNSDGTIACCVYDREKGVLGWSLWETQGQFNRMTIINSPTYLRNNHKTMADSVYLLVIRDNVKFIEKFEEQNIFLDAMHGKAYVNSDTIPPGNAFYHLEWWDDFDIGAVEWVAETSAGSGYLGSDPSNFATLKQLEVESVVSNNDDDVTVTFNRPATNVHVGLKYQAKVVSMPVALVIQEQLKKGDIIKLVRVWCELLKTSQLKIDGRDVIIEKHGAFSNSGAWPLEDYFDYIVMSKMGRNLKLEFVVDDPVRCTFLGFSMEVKI